MLQLALPALLAVPASAASCVTGVQPPLAGAGPWVINIDTIIPEGCQVSHGDDIYLVPGKRLGIYGGILTLSGWLNVSLGSTLEMNAFGAIHVPPGTPSVRLRIATGAILSLRDAVLDLEGVDAVGPSNQGSLEMINSTLTGRSSVNISTNSVLIQGSTVNVTVPNAQANTDGANGSLHIGGRIFADVSDSTFYLRAANGGVGTAGGNGGRGGTATAIFEPRSVNYVSITVIGGQGGTGAQGANGAAGGQGGQGGSASFSQSADAISNSQIRIAAGAGGSGASGAAWNNGSGGDGGAPKRGGDATGRIAGYNGLTLTQITFTVNGGNGGTGGSGGKYTGLSASPQGGDAASGAQGGAATAAIEAPGAVVLNYVTVTATAGPGGLGGNYGEGPQGSQVQDGSAGSGGDGGNANARTNSFSNQLRTSNSTVLARAGAGGQGGDGSLQGGDGGEGGDAFAGAFGRNAVTLFDSCYNATGGPGGPAKPGQLTSGYGGNGGDATTRINSTGLIVMSNACAGALRGRGGTAQSTGRGGSAGILEDLFVNGSKIDFSHSKFGNALDDYNGLDTGRLYNVTFTTPLGGSPVIPLGPHKVEMYWQLTVHVTDGRDPIPGVRALVTRCPQWVGGASFDQATTGADGIARFILLAWVYSSASSGTQFVGCYMIESQYEGRQQDPRQDFLDGNHLVEFAYYSNNEAPRVTALQPSAAVYKIDDDHPNIPVLVRVDDPDDAQTGVLTVFKVWVCVATEPQCVDRTDISHTRTVDNNTREVRYNWTFNVSNVNEYASGQYFICSKASDSFLESPWTCKGFAINQVLDPLPQAELSGGSKIRDEATKMINFDGRVNNLETLANYTVPITILVYRWDFDGDGTWDYYSTTNGKTAHIYPNVDQTTVYRANFSVIDSLGRESRPVSREITIDPHVIVQPGVIEIYGFVILYALIGAVGVTGSAFVVQRRRQAREAEEAAQREAEILANIHECPRCSDLLPEKFAVCIRCATEDGIASVRKTVGELKQVGVIVLEEEDLIDKANIAFEGRDFETAGQFLEKVKTRVDVNKKRHGGTTALIRRERLYIRMLEEQGKDLAHLEPEVYHAELALGRSDFDGADRMVEDIRKKIQAVVYEDKRREILERFTKLERQVKSKDQTDDEVRLKATEALRLLERAKVALGKRSFVEAVQYYTEAFVLTEGAPPDPIIKEPSDEEFDLFETRLKMQEEGVYMGPAAQGAGTTRQDKVWRPGEKEFKVQESAQVWRPGEHATTMAEGQAHGRDVEEGPAKPPAPEPMAPPKPAPAPQAPPAPSYVMEPVPPKEAKLEQPEVKAAPPPAAPPAPAPVAPATGAAPALKCAVCGTALKAGWKRCPKCATPVPDEAAGPAAPAAATAPAGPPASAPAAAAPANCPNCKKPVKPNWKKCPYCANPLQ